MKSESIIEIKNKSDTIFLIRKKEQIKMSPKKQIIVERNEIFLISEFIDIGEVEKIYKITYLSLRVNTLQYIHIKQDLTKLSSI